MFSKENIAEFLSQLIQVDTTNPPGNETPAAKLVAEKLDEHGIENKIFESEPGRGSIVAWAESKEPGPSLLLLSHLDVVPASPEEWSVDPFSGVIKDGFVWGRGALDDKGPVAVELFTFISLVESGKFKGKLIYAATADEEMGGRKGAGWLVDKHPELVKADYVINEGGGVEIPGKRRSVFIVQTAEKGVYWLKLAFKGKPGHASMPKAGENAVLTAAVAVKRINEHPPPIHATSHVKIFVEKMLAANGAKWLAPILFNPLFGDVALNRMPDKQLAAMLDAMLRNTFAPTVISGGGKVNIIPSSCELKIDCRLLPGHDDKWAEDYLKRTLEGLDYELEFIHREPPTESPINTPLYRAITETVKAEVKNADVSPFMSTGGTDSRFFRRKFGSIAYGFTPLRADIPFSEILKMIHGIDERISLRNLEFSYKILLNTAIQFYSSI